MAKPTAKTNASTTRTRKKIDDVFLKLAEKHDFADITVNMITTEAGLNRTTFYLHYSTIDDLIEKVITEIVDELSQDGFRLATTPDLDDKNWQDTYYRTIAARPALFHRLLSNPASSPLGARLRAVQIGFIKATWKQRGHDLETHVDAWDLRARFATAGVWGATLHWIESGMVESADSVCRRTLEMILLVGSATKSPE